MRNNLDIIAEMLKNGETIYIKDDFYDMALRIFKDGDGAEHYFRKVRGGHSYSPEAPIDPRESDTANEVILGGEFITKEEYEGYDALPDEM